VKLFQTQW